MRAARVGRRVDFGRFSHGLSRSRQAPADEGVAKPRPFSPRQQILLTAFRKVRHTSCSSQKSCQAPRSPQFPATISFHAKNKVPNHVIFTPLNLSYWY
jgi:hypothetical protein